MKTAFWNFSVLSLCVGLFSAPLAQALPVNQGVTTAFIDTRSGMLRVKCAGCTKYVDAYVVPGHRVIDFNMEGDTILFRSAPRNADIGRDTVADLYVVADTRTGRAEAVAGEVDHYAVDSGQAAIGYRGMTFVAPNVTSYHTWMTMQLKETPMRLALNGALAFTKRGFAGNELYVVTDFKQDMQAIKVADGVDDLFRVNGSVLAYTVSQAWGGKALHVVDLRGNAGISAMVGMSINAYQVETWGAGHQPLGLVVYSDTSGNLKAAWPGYAGGVKSPWIQRDLGIGVQDFKSDGGVILSRSRFGELLLHPLDSNAKPEVLGSNVSDYKLLGDRVGYIDVKGGAYVATGLSQRGTVRFHKLDTGFGTPVQQIALGADGTVVAISGGTLFVAKDLYSHGGNMVPVPTNGPLQQIEMRDGRIYGVINGKGLPLDCLLKLSKF